MNQINEDQYWKLVGDVIKTIGANQYPGVIASYAIQPLINDAINQTNNALMNAGVVMVRTDYEHRGVEM